MSADYPTDRVLTRPEAVTFIAELRAWLHATHGPINTPKPKPRSTR